MSLGALRASGETDLHRDGLGFERERLFEADGLKSLMALVPAGFAIRRITFCFFMVIAAVRCNLALHFHVFVACTSVRQSRN